MSRLRLAFAGTPELARVVLESIITQGKHSVEIVFTQPDRPAGRGRKLKQSEVKRCALDHNLPVQQPESAKQLDRSLLKDCDVMLVVAYGLLLNTDVLNTPKLGCINIHTSLLPRWRGAAPIQRAIEAGDTETGLTIMQMDAGLDTGPILEQYHCPILPSDTAEDLHNRLAQLGADNINDVLTRLAENKIEKLEQDDTQANYANKISKQEAELNWNKSAIELERKIRAFNPFPVAHAEINNVRLRIWEAKVKDNMSNAQPGTILKNKDSLDIVTAKGILVITQLQAPGKKKMSAKAFLNGNPDFIS